MGLQHPDAPVQIRSAPLKRRFPGNDRNDCSRGFFVVRYTKQFQKFILCERIKKNDVKSVIIECIVIKGIGKRRNGTLLYSDYIFTYCCKGNRIIGSSLYCIFLINVKKYQYNGIWYFVLLVVFMSTGIAIQLWDSSLKVDYITTAIAAIMLYVLTWEMIYQTDDLTELLNRRGYENYVAHMEEKRKKEQRLPYISIGYSFYDPEIQNVQDVVSEADQMMYQYKKDHRDRTLQ